MNMCDIKRKLYSNNKVGGNTEKSKVSKDYDNRNNYSV